MQGLLEALERVSAAAPAGNPARYRQLLDRVHRTALRRALGADGTGGDPQPEDLAELRRLAFYVAAETLELPERRTQALQDGLYVAATIFELLATYGRPADVLAPPNDLVERLSNGDLADHVRALVLYSLGRHEANSAVIGARLLRRLPPPSDDPVDAVVLTGLHAVVALLSRDLARAVALGRNLGALLDRGRDRWQGAQFPAEHGRFLAVWLRVGEGVAATAGGMLLGSDDLLAAGRRLFDEATDVASAVRHEFGLWIAHALTLVVDEMASRSVHRVLRGSGLPPSYVQQLAATGTPELWSSQVEVVRAGLLTSELPFVVNLPTGAGKSLIAEMSIVQSLATGQGAWALYLVPTRALVHQVEADLRRRLPARGVWVRTVLAGAEPGSMLDAELGELAAPRTVTILTPEKLDIYFRNRPDAFADCRLLIIDEAHKIGDARRGATLETLITRFRLLVPTARALLLSAAMSNHLEIADWLGNPDGAVRSRWRPTRQVKGLAVPYDVQRTYEPTVYQGKHRTVTRTRYRGGLCLAGEPSEIVQLGLDVPNLFQGEVRTWTSTSKQFVRKGPSAPDHAADLAIRFARLRGVVVVFVGQQSSAEKAAEAVAEGMRAEDRPPVPYELVAHLAGLIGPGHPVVSMVRRGVAYHHAGLPRPVRRAIESALRRNELRAVCATATLQEGLNTPATTVIVAGTHRYDPDSKTSQTLAEVDFTNIAGRAGRAGRDTEGHVILVAANFERGPTPVRTVGNQYLFPPEAAFVVESAFARIEEELARIADDDDAIEVSRATQTALLALEAAGLTTEDEIERFFDASLALRQVGRTARPAATAAHRHLGRTRERVGEERLLRYARTALPIADCDALSAALTELLEGGYDVSEPIVEDGRVVVERLRPLIDAVLRVQAVRVRGLAADGAADTATDVLARWIGGDGYTDLAASPTFGGKVEKVVDYLGPVTNELAWGLGAAFLFLDLDAGTEIHPHFGLLPLLTEFGVDDPVAAYLCLLGVSDRRTARRLAAAYPRASAVGVPAFGDVEDWIKHLRPRDVAGHVPPTGLQYRVLVEDLGLHERRDDGLESGVRWLFGRAAPAAGAPHRDPPIGTLCRFVDNGRGELAAIDAMSGRTFGAMGNSDAIRGFAGGEVDRLVGLVTAVRAGQGIDLSILGQV